MRLLYLIVGGIRFLKGRWILGFVKPKEFIYWGHLGLGDMICSAKLFEFWSDFGLEVHVPCRAQNIRNIKEIYSYLPNLHFHEIPNEFSQEEQAVKNLAKTLNCRLIDGGRLSLEFVKVVWPHEGNNILLMKCADYHTQGLYSERFREHVLSLRQIQPPIKKYKFLNLRSSLGEYENPFKAGDSADAILVEQPDEPIFSHAKLMDEAEQLHSIGSSFLCLALVIGAKPKIKYLYSSIEPLKSDDPQSEWLHLPPLTPLSGY